MGAPRIVITQWAITTETNEHFRKMRRMGNELLETLDSAPPDRWPAALQVIGEMSQEVYDHMLLALRNPWT
jgi:hypothetical protein